MKTCIEHKLYHLTLEKMVIGLEEPILIKGIGRLIAKVDSGNSGYNVIHGEDLIIQGNVLNFKTIDQDGNDKRVSKKIKDTIKVNIGGGHIQERPVVELDVQFAGENYKKILFSVTNRSDNEHKVLISKDFVGKELEALIDVTKDNISDENIVVDYVSEGVLGSVASGIMKGATALVKGTEGQERLLNKLQNLRKSINGEKIESVKKAQINPQLEQGAKNIKNLSTLIKKTDPTLIKNQLIKEQEKLEKLNLNFPLTAEDIAVFKILDYTGGTCDDKNANPEFKARIIKALKAYKKLKYKEANGIPVKNNNVNEQQKVTENVENNNLQQGSPSTPQQSSNNLSQPSPEENNTENIIELDNAQIEKSPDDMSINELEEVLKEVVNRKEAVFYLINFKKDNKEQELQTGKEMLNKIKQKIDSWNKKISNGKNWSFEAFKPFVKDIINDVKTNSKGLFALCTMPMNNRKVEFFIDNNFLIDGASEETTNENKETLSEFVEEYNQLNTEYQQLGGNGDISEEGINSLLQGGEQPQDEMSAFIEEYNNLNNEYLQIADDMGQSGNNINEQDIQALIELAQESAQNKQANELGQNDQGDMHDETNYSYHTETENEERKIK